MTHRQSKFLLTMLLSLLALMPALVWSADGAALARELPPGLQVPEAAKPGPDFDVERATEAYLNLLTPEQRAKSDAYFEGGYWLQLWQLLYGIGISAVLLASGLSRRMRDHARRISARPWLSTALYAAMFLLATQIISLPLSIYTEFVREHAYGLSTQTFGAWLGDAAKGSAISLVFAPFLIAGLYALVRRVGDRWWLYAGMASCVFILFVSMISPVFVAPMFNDG